MTKQIKEGEEKLETTKRELIIDFYFLEVDPNNKELTKEQKDLKDKNPTEKSQKLTKEIKDLEKV